MKMEKFVTAKIDKVSNYIHIHDDIAFSILSKLPLKTLKRFGSVCKLWSLLFENPNFMSMYRINFLSKNHPFYDDTSLLIYQENRALYSISDDRFEKKVKLDWPNPFEVDDDVDFNILGSCSINGILCIYCKYEWDLILWNPTTKEFKIIPNNHIDSKSDYYLGSCIFGYDRVRDDYKVIQYAITFPNPDGDDNELPVGSWEIYSLGRNTWKKLNGDEPRCIDYEQVFLNGVAHWGSKLETHNEACLVSFDFSNEIFFTTPIPSDIMPENFDFTRVWRYLVVLNGSIALILNYPATTTFHISILGEVGVKDSWTKLFVVELLPCIDYPIGVWKNGDMFFTKKDGELTRFDLNSHMIEELGIIIKNRFSSKIVIYKESYLPIIRGESD